MDRIIILVEDISRLLINPNQLFGQVTNLYWSFLVLLPLHNNELEHSRVLSSQFIPVVIDPSQKSSFPDTSDQFILLMFDHIFILFDRGGQIFYILTIVGLFE